jgi:phage terminase small subunit
MFGMKPKWQSGDGKEDHRTPEEAQAAAGLIVAAETAQVQIPNPEDYGISHPIEKDMWERGLRSKEYMNDWREVELVHLARYCRLFRMTMEIEEEAMRTPFTSETMTKHGGVIIKAHPIHDMYHRYLNQLSRAGRYLKFNPKQVELPVPYDEMLQFYMKATGRYHIDGRANPVDDAETEDDYESHLLA